MKSYELFLKEHESKKDLDKLRLGQRFVIAYILKPWPELFYAGEEKAKNLIKQWLKDHNYEEYLPKYYIIRNK